MKDYKTHPRPMVEFYVEFKRPEDIDASGDGATIRLEILRGGETFDLYVPGTDIGFEDCDIRALAELRDFLNYAVADVSSLSKPTGGR